VHRPAVGLALAAVVLAALAVGFLGLPREGSALPVIARRAILIALPRWHTTEVVNEIVYGTRGFDTFGETFLLLGAVVGIVLLSRGKEQRSGFLPEEELAEREQSKVDADAPGGHGGAEPEAATAEQEEREEEEGDSPPGPPTDADEEGLGETRQERAPAMTLVVRGGTRIVIPLLAAAGIYLVAWGYTPGGGFPAGAVVTGVVLFVYAAYGPRSVRRVVRADLLETVELAGAALIIAVEALGLILSGSFSANWLPLGSPRTIVSGGVLQAFSGGELIEVATGLLLAIFSLLTMGRDWVEDLEQEAHAGEGPSRPASARRR
jgi:multicomponent Na+:H+ antiporter subunit B